MDLLASRLASILLVTDFAPSIKPNWSDMESYS